MSTLQFRIHRWTAHAPIPHNLCSPQILQHNYGELITLAATW